MRERSRGTWFVAISLAVGLAGGLVAQAWAQYPPAGGSVVLAAENTTPALGEEIAVTATVQDQEGIPASGVECTFSIAQQPGDDASVDSGPFTSDAAGNVSTTLDTGSTAGTIVVEAACAELSAQVSVVTTSSGPETPAAPPASPPETGTGAEAGGTNGAFWALVGTGVVIGLCGLAVAWRRIRA